MGWMKRRVGRDGRMYGEMAREEQGEKEGKVEW